MAKILITGSEGHIGKHLSKALRPHNTLRELDLVNNQHTKHINTIYSDYNPDIIYHLGEYARIAPSFDEPNIVLDRNLVGTAAVLEYWRHKHCKLVYAASSSKFDDVGANPY